MGYSARAFQDMVQPWLDAGWLAPGKRLIEFGAQEFHAGPADVCREVSSFLERPITEAPSIRAVFEAIGVSYTSIDVDGAHGSLFFDLNTGETPHEWRETFDFVNNEGTAEHLINPINAFHVAHEMAKVDGVIRHSFPLFGWPDHGFLYPTPKFCAHLVGENGYEVLWTFVSEQEATDFNDGLFRFPMKVRNLWAQLVYRKTSDRPFVIPVDHVNGPNAETARARLRENYRRHRP